MVVKTKKWWPWLSPVSKKFIVRLIVRRLQGCDLLPNAAREGSRLVVEIRWKGSKMTLGSLRRNSAARNLTKEAVVDGATVVDWDEEFETSCNLNSDKDNFFKPWEIAFTLFKVRLSLSVSIRFVLKFINWIHQLRIKDFLNVNLEIGDLVLSYVSTTCVHIDIHYTV